MVPALATYSVDDGFSYRIPDGLADRVEVGSIVRIPLSGRRVRGYVIGTRSGATARLKEIIAVSGDVPVFTPQLFETLRWAAIHYVAPLAVLLAKAAPPNLPRLRSGAELPPIPVVPTSTQASAIAATLERPQRSFIVGPGPWAEMVVAAAAAAVAASRSILVICPTLQEARSMHSAVQRTFGDRAVLAASGVDPADVTRAWTTAATLPGTIVIGTREAAYWPVAALGRAFVIGENRRGMKDQQTPTTHVREILRRRAGVERFGLLSAGPLPSTEASAFGVEIVATGPRWWPLVEVVDRAEDPPGGGLLARRVRQAVSAAVKQGRRVFLFTHRRGYAPAFRCVRCREIRTCSECGARPDRAEHCPRCGSRLQHCVQCGGTRFEPLGAGVGRVLDEVGRIVGDRAGPAGSGAQVQVGTERDLVEIGSVDLAVIVDADGLMLAPHYRAAEDALRTMARVAGKVGVGQGRRCMVQTGMPGGSVISALRRGDATEFLTAEVALRAADGFPPYGEILVVELTNPPPDADTQLRHAAGGTDMVHGPAVSGERNRWLLQARDLRRARIALRSLVQDWRDRGATVRIDADPIDL